MVKRKAAAAIILFIAIICSIFGFAACEHVHTFSEEWTTNATEHWHQATCEHENLKSDKNAHVDGNNDGKCDVCGYETRHTHTFDNNIWMSDNEAHWHAATCGHDDEKADYAPHVDENDDGICDVCKTKHNHTYSDKWSGDETEHWHAATCSHSDLRSDVGEHEDENEDEICDVCQKDFPHTHTFSESEWKFDLTEHWRPATCRHSEEKGSEAEHNFANNGICVCGVKLIEKEVYTAVVSHELTEDDFQTWLEKIKEDGVTAVRLSEKGDIVYERDGKPEGLYVAERTVKVKAVCDGEGLADVWIKVVMLKDGKSYEENGTDALALGKTGQDGVAELRFSPKGGYSDGSKVQYALRYAEAKDMAVLLGQDETSCKPSPDRYSIKGSAAGSVEINENDTVGSDIDGQLEFQVSKGWEGYNKIFLPYVRYYSNPLEPDDEEISEDGKEFTFQTSGNDLFDYMYFYPGQKYNWSAGKDTDEYDQITDNFKKAASGIYKISFTVTGDANVRLYFWDEGGVDLGAYYKKKPDGTPDDSYVTSISGTQIADSVITEDKFTGENSVNVTVITQYGLRLFQLGLLSDKVCSVKFTVERTADYIEPASGGSITLGDNDNGGEGYRVKGYGLTNDNITKFDLIDVPEGLYYLTLKDINSRTPQPGAVVAYINYSDRSMIWQENSYKGIIRIKEGDEALYIVYGLQSDMTANIKLERYDAVPTLELDQTAYLPCSGLGGEEYDIKIGDSVAAASKNVAGGFYTISITVFGYAIANRGVDVNIKIGGATYLAKTTDNYGTAKYVIDVDSIDGDTIKITNTSAAIKVFISEVKITYTSIPKIELGVQKEVEFKDSTLFNDNLFIFTAAEAGTYKITINLIKEEENDLGVAIIKSNLKYMGVEDKTHNNAIIDAIKKTQFDKSDNDDIIRTRTGTFTLERGEKITLNVFRPQPVGFVLGTVGVLIEYVPD